MNKERKRKCRELADKFGQIQALIIDASEFAVDNDFLSSFVLEKLEILAGTAGLLRRLHVVPDYEETVQEEAE